MPPAHSPRYHALDGLRGAAALLVVLFHVGWRTHLVDLPLVKNAYLAVDLFFILSGFVIAANYAKAITSLGDAAVFMQRRFFRLYPLHLAVLIGLVALEALKLLAQGVVTSEVAPFTGPNSPRLLIENLLMMQGLGLDDRLGWNPPSWSISTEFCAYALFALAALLGLLRRSGVVAGAALASCVTYGAIAVTRQTLDVTFALGLLRCCAGFTLGVAIEFFSRGECRPLAASKRRLIGLGALALTILTPLALNATEGSMTVGIVALFVALVALLQHDVGPAARFFASAPLQFAGRVSYSVYLLHMPLLLVTTMILKRLLHAPSFGGSDGHVAILQTSPVMGDALLLAFMVVLLALARATYALIEEPGRRLGARLVVSALISPRPAFTPGP